MRRSRMNVFRAATGLAVLAACALHGSSVRAQAPQAPAAERAPCGQRSGFHQAAPDLDAALAADATALQLIETIVAQVGMTANFLVRAARSGDISAVVCQDRALAGKPSGRYVVYDPRLVANVTTGTANYWTMMLALAHEIGHHVNTHDLDGRDRKRLEQEADFFAGYVLARLGAGQQETSAATGRLAVLHEEASGLPAGQRLAEVERGWLRGQETRDGGGGGAQAPASQAPQVPSSQAESSQASSSQASAALAPAVAVAVRAKPRAAITVKPDTYLEGEGYAALPDLTALMCREACAHETRCVTYEYHRPTRTCGLFDRAAPSGPSSDAEVGVKTAPAAQVAGWRSARREAPAPVVKPKAPDVAPAVQARLSVRTNVYVEGHGYKIIRNTSTFVCRTACMDDARCAMYEYYKPTGGCGLYDHTRTAGQSSDAEAGVKVTR